MSPRGFWDWGVNPAGVVLAPQIGPAELAVRLGSPVLYDRLGEVIDLETWEDGMNRWQASGSIDPGTLALSTAFPRTGGYALRITPGTLSGADQAAEHLIAFPRESRMALEMSFRYGALDMRAVCELQLYDGTRRLRVAVRHTNDTGTWEYLDSAGAWQTLLDTRDLVYTSPIYHTVKFVVDWGDKEYVRARLNGETVSMASIAAQDTADATIRHVFESIAAGQPISGSGFVDFDDVILTQNEP